jgi:polyisoprenoid-binding protein YceI
MLDSLADRHAVRQILCQNHRMSDDAGTPDLTPAAPEPKSRTRFIKWVVLGIIGLVVLLFAGIFFYANVLNDAPDKLDASDLSNALVQTTPPPDTVVVRESVPAPTTPSEAPPADPAPATTPSVDDGSFDGDWAPTDASEFGYRVEEVLAGVNTTAVGRSNEITGLLTIDGTTATAVDVEVQVDSIKSDSALRDNQFAGRIMNAEEFPTATFQLTEPIEFGAIPTGDEQVVATATGELTLRGVTNPVTFEVTAQTTGGRIGVLGSIPVVFADYGIENPSFGQVKTEDEGLVEFVLVFERAT